MACATLKRSLDWETLNQHPSKRRRCNPFGETGSSASAVAGTHDDVANTHTNSSNGLYLPKAQPSPFMEANASLSKISPDKMTQNIRDEIKRLHRSKQLQLSSVVERMQDSESSSSEMGPDSPRRPDTPPNINRNPEKAVFTFKQVQMICERMLKDRENELREKYDTILSTKLAEQYDAFVKFTYDQIQRRYEAAPSYLS